MMRRSFDSLGFKPKLHDRSGEGSRIMGTAAEPPIVTGTFTFPNRIKRPCILVTVDEKTELEKLAESVFQTMDEFWGLKRPGLLISVTGGAKDYKQNPGIDEIVKVGLVDAAVSTGAWLITGGTSTGVMKLVGDAVKEHIEAKGKPKSHGIVALGIATWGFVDATQRCNFEPDEKNRKLPVLKPQGLDPDFAELDASYTHFILVNNGSQGKPTGEIRFRSKLEKCIQQKRVAPAKEDKAKPAPIVLIVVEGGPGTMETVRVSLEDRSPVVVVANSGRTADYITNSLQVRSRRRTKGVLAFFPNIKSETKKKLETHMEVCLRKKDKITIFHSEKDSLETDIQTAVLKAVGKDKDITPAQVFKLAIQWHRWDCVVDEMTKNGRTKLWMDEDFNSQAPNILLKAILEDQCDFVKYFLDAGVPLKDLAGKLYKKMYEDDNGEKTMKTLLRYASGFFWKERDILSDDYIQRVVAHLMRDTHFSFDKGDKKDERYLFLWAVLFNHKEMALLFWKVCSDHLGGALFASALLKRLSKIAGKKESEKLSKELTEHSVFWEQVAYEVLDECQKIDETLTNRSLVRKLLYWGRKHTDEDKDPDAPSLFNMVEAHEMMVFAGHSACQNKLDAVWKGRMAVHTHNLLIFFCTFLPVLIPLISFKIDEKRPQGSNKIEHSNQKKVVTEKDKVEQADKTTQASKRKGKNCPVGLLKIYYFYSAPMTKFFCNVIAYLGFLGIFSYFVLIELSKGSPSILEYFTWVWLFTMVIEEIRQMMFRDNVSIKYRVLSWISNLWNQVDVTIIVIFVISVVLRISLPIFDGDFRWARSFYSVSLALSFIRFMQYFYAVKAMGPKVIMMQKMMADMFLFLAVLLVFVLGFGVAYHANMFPNSPATWYIVVDVVYYPYFQMYGELFLDHLKGEKDDEKCTKVEAEWRENPSKRCPEDSRAIVNLLLGAYLIMINIMLVNLLIAMFSYTFQEVQEKSVLIWQYYRLTLVHDYFDRPTLVPPFIVVNHINRAFRYLCGAKRTDKFRRTYSLEKMQCQTSFERLAVKKYFARKARREKELKQSQRTAVAELVKESKEDDTKTTSGQLH